LRSFREAKGEGVPADFFFFLFFFMLQAHQNHSLTEILDEAHAFVDSSNLQRSKDLEMCLKRVVFKMQLLSRVYKVCPSSPRLGAAVSNSYASKIPADLALSVHPSLSQPILSTHLFLSALGSILDAVLARILHEIIALQDITTKESHRLNEICKMIHPLEELFVEEPGMVSLRLPLSSSSFLHARPLTFTSLGSLNLQYSSVVAFVPLWLKFCYLSELLVRLSLSSFSSSSSSLLRFSSWFPFNFYHH